MKLFLGTLCNFISIAVSHNTLWINGSHSTVALIILRTDFQLHFIFILQKYFENVRTKTVLLYLFVILWLLCFWNVYREWLMQIPGD
jgi:hypothetical protein